MSNELTPKQKKFADNYIESGNATQSAIKAGYSRKTAKSVGSENLTKPDIKSYIKKKMKEVESHKIMDAKEAMELLTRIARGEEKETVIVGTADGLASTTKEADLKTRINATKELLKRYPDNDKLLEQQIRKITAEADIAEARAKSVDTSFNDEDRTIILDDMEDDN
ncbi:MAG: terminase small subunit [Pediococcus pentosaceus]|jgi:phage terminase small subunit|nr:terminase small subunit [Pediococcus pentosaceus]MCH4059228.1 terminase small subunit [Pediococcus pentosaceus]MCI1506542.1 terminase small subunit [Pediococcus pentosaceus]